MKQLSYHWHLRAKMADRGMFSTTDLQPYLAERGINLSREQIYRLVTGHPQRLSMDTLIALCDILECTPNDLIEAKVTDIAVKKTVGQTTPKTTPPTVRRRTMIQRPGGAS